MTFQGAATHEPVAKMRAMTISGLCLFLDISRQGWSEYGAKPDFSDITARIDDVIRSQKFAGAAAGVNITAVGTALTPAANGMLGIAATSDLVVAYADEIFNNNTSTDQLIRIRPAGSQSYLSAGA